MDLEQHLINTTSNNWLEIANQFELEGTSKQKSDRVRRLAEKVRNEYDPNNVLVIADLHIPFELDGYLEFCIEQQRRFKCGKVISIGDVIDNHYSSYHDTNPDGYSAGQELNLCITKLKDWYKAFPSIIVTAGNHDRLLHRKAVSSGVSARWIRPLNEVLEVSDWKFVEQYEHNGILYVHGEQGQALAKAQNEFKSVVSGHHHTEGYVKLINGGKNFAMQVGTGIDFETYAFSYAQRGKQPVLSCGVIYNNTPIIVPYYDCRIK